VVGLARQLQALAAKACQRSKCCAPCFHRTTRRFRCFSAMGSMVPPRLLGIRPLAASRSGALLVPAPALGASTARFGIWALRRRVWTHASEPSAASDHSEGVADVKVRVGREGEPSVLLAPRTLGSSAAAHF